MSRLGVVTGAVRAFMPRIARHYSWPEQAFFVAIGLATIYEGLIMVLSLGFLNVGTRAYVLFHDWEGWEDDK